MNPAPPPAAPAPRRYLEATRRFCAGARANIIQQAVLIAGHLVLVPLFISHWGDEAYGAWLLLVAFTAWLSLADLGFSTSALNAIADAAARGDQKTLARRTRSALRATAVMAITVVLVSAVLSATAARWPVLHLPGTSATKTSFSVLLLGLAVAAGFPQGVLVGMYRAVGEYARGVTIQTSSRACSLALTAVLILCGGGIFSVAAIQATVACGFLVGTAFDLSRRHPTLPIGVAEGELRYAASFIRPGLLFLVVQIAAMLSLQGSALLVGSVCGAATLAVFGATRTLANFCRQVFGNLGIALWSETTTLAATRDRDALAAVHRIFGRIMVAVALIIAATLTACGDELFLIWTRGVLRFDELLFAALLLHLVQQAYWSTSATILLSWNRHRPVAVLQAAASVLGLAIGASLISTWGPASLIFAAAGAEALLCGIFLPIAADRAIRALPMKPGAAQDHPFHVDLLPGLIPVAASAFLASTATAALFADPVNPLVRWSAAAIATCVATSVATFFWFQPKDRAMLRSVVAARLPTRRLAPEGTSK